MQLGKKDFASVIIGFWPITRLFSLINKIRAQSITILAYHRVYDINNDSGFKYDKELVSASCQQFEWQIKYIKKYYNAITFHDLHNLLKTKSKIPKNTIIVTFDDGYMDNYSNAYRILKENNIPAVFYVSTQYIGSNELFWFDKIAYHLKNTNNKKIVLEEFKKDLDLTTDLNIEKSIKTVLALCKVIPNADRERLISKIVNECQSESVIHKCEHLPMTWGCVKEMSDYGYEIGSHSVSHAILSQLNSKELENELRNSKIEIEENTKKTVISIAYPVGGYSAISHEIFDAVKASGYKYGCTYIPGDNKLSSLDNFNLKRAHIERYTTKSYFKAMLLLPSLFG